MFLVTLIWELSVADHRQYFPVWWRSPWIESDCLTGSIPEWSADPAPPDDPWHRAGQKVRAQRFSVLLLGTVPSSFRAEHELDLVSMAPGLQMSHNNPQAPALSWMYVHDAFHQKNPVGKAYPAPNRRQKKILSFVPFLFTLFKQHGLLWIHAVLEDIKKESAWPQFIVQFPLKFGEPQFPLLLIGILMASASLIHDRVVRIKGKCVQEFCRLLTWWTACVVNTPAGINSVSIRSVARRRCSQMALNSWKGILM